MLRLIIALLLALAAAPMPAMACDGGQPMAMSGTMPRGEHQAPVTSTHDCIGCATDVDWDAARITPPAPIAGPALATWIAVLPLLPGQAPTPPPPRIA